MSKTDISPHILWVAAENGALPGGKVGGIGDVVHRLPPVLADLGTRVTVITPSHGFLHHVDGAAIIHRYAFLFRGYPHEAEIWEIDLPGRHPQVRQLVVHHPILSAFDPARGKYVVYTHDPPDRPFFNDATRFAFFCKAVAAAVSQGLFDTIDCLHLHDWHAAFLAILRRFHLEHRNLQPIHTVYSIHNLAFQGNRPLRDNESSLEAWFPEMGYDWYGVYDPRWLDNVNPAAAAIRLTDVVHTVSPSYATEIQASSQKPAFYGGEGLETDLKRAATEGRLTGILNGCDYPPETEGSRPGLDELLDRFRPRIIRWAGRRDTVDAAHFVAYARILELRQRSAATATDMFMTAVCRLGEQKTLILRANGGDGRPGLVSLLEALGDQGLFVLLGEGDPDYERFFARISADFDNFIFLNGFSETCADALYTGGDLFVMPSSFEPCGLSQMMAMRHGQPCLVHAVGGLKDTVRDQETGFTFNGKTLEAQVDHMVQSARRAINLKRTDPEGWLRLCRQAAAARFSWQDTAGQYLTDLYRVDKV